MSKELLTENFICQGKYTSTIFYLVFPELFELTQGKKIKNYSDRVNLLGLKAKSYYSYY
jgi:hypothetical protein